MADIPPTEDRTQTRGPARPPIQDRALPWRGLLAFAILALVAWIGGPINPK
jgi:hypothetical protein